MTDANTPIDVKSASDRPSQNQRGIDPGGLATPTTMAAALALFATSNTLTPRRRAAIIADVKQAFLREPGLAELPPNGYDVRFMLLKLKGSKRGKNIRANIRAMLTWLHDALPATKRPPGVSDTWAALLTNPLLTMNERFTITRLGRYCSLRGIEPKDVGDALVVKFHNYVTLLGTVDNPRKSVTRVIASWNTAATKVEFWPGRNLSKWERGQPPQRTPNLDQIDGKLSGELKACGDWMAGTVVGQSAQAKRFDLRLPHEGGPSGRRRLLKASTVENYSRYLRRSARILGEAINKPLSKLELAEVVVPANVETIMCIMADELALSGKGERAIQSAHCALSYVARHYFRLSPTELAGIKWLGDQLARPEPTLTKKNLARLRRLVLAKRFELMRLPAFLLNRAVRLIKVGRHQEKDLVDAQVAVAISVLLTIPIRLGNLAAVRLGKHLDLPMKVGTEGRLQMPGEMVKNNVAIDRCVPVDVAEVLRAYIRHVLPLLRSNPTSTALFPGAKDDSCRVASGLGTQISRRIKKHIGVDMNAHLFRHFAAIMYLEEHPNEYEVVRLLLGNRNLDTVKAYYTTVQNEAAISKANKVSAEQKRRAGLNPNNMLEVVKSARHRPGRALE